MSAWLDNADKIASVLSAIIGLVTLLVTVRQVKLGRRADSVSTNSKSADAEGQPDSISVAPDLGPRPARIVDGVTVVGLLVVFAASFGLSWLVVWLLVQISGGVVGPLWIIFGASVTFAVRFSAPVLMMSLSQKLRRAQKIGLSLFYSAYILVQSWCVARGFSSYWFPTYYNSPRAFPAFFVLGIILSLISVMIVNRALVRRFD